MDDLITSTPNYSSIVTVGQFVSFFCARKNIVVGKMRIIGF